MRSGTSFFDRTVFKKTVARFWPVWAAYSIIWLVLFPLNGLMMIRLDAESAARGVTSFNLATFARSTVPGATEVVLFFAVIFGVLSAMAVCSHLYNARSANFFATLPIRREGLFLTHYLAGLSFFIVPNVVIFLLTLLIETAGGVVFLPGLLFWLGVACGECLFFYSMAVFCGMFTGHILALPAFYGIFNALAYALYFLLTAVFESFYYGFSGFESGVREFVKWLTPVGNLMRGLVYYRNSENVQGYSFEGLDIVAVYTAVGVVLAVGAFLLYRARRLESAGDVVSVKPMRPVFKYSVAFCSGLCFGMLTTAAVNLREPGLMVSMLVWAIIGYFAAQMLLDKSFRVFKKWKGAAAVAGAFILMYLVVGFDLTGYETRVPSPDQVDSVEVSGVNLISLGDGADYLYAEEESRPFIEHVVQLHQAAVDQRDEDDVYGRPNAGDYSLRLVYHLKNGSTLTRRYYTWVDVSQADQEGSAAWAIQQIYDDRDVYWKAYGFDNADQLVAEEGFRMEEVEILNYGYEDYDTVEYHGDREEYYYHGEPVRTTPYYYYGEDAWALYEAVKEDFKAGRIGVRRVENYNDDWRRVLQLYFAFRDTKENEYGSYSRCTVSIAVQDTASSTLAVLERLGEK